VRSLRETWFPDEDFAAFYDVDSNLAAVQQAHAKEGITIGSMHGYTPKAPVPENQSFIDIEKVFSPIGQQAPNPGFEAQA
jgi:hypothetical protein